MYRKSFSRARPSASLAVMAGVVFWLVPDSRAADYAATESLFLGGQYDDAAEVAGGEVARGIWNERWVLLQIRALLARGRAGEAVEAYRGAVTRYSSSIPLRLLGVQALRAAGEGEEARRAWDQIGEQLRTSPSRYASREKLVAMGRYYAGRGEDARQVLRLFFDRVREADPDFLEAYIATAELAIAKGDFRVASETLRQAESVDPTDPRLFYLQAQAWAPSDPSKAQAAIDQALRLNPNHVDSLLFRVDQLIDREAYGQAHRLITRVLGVNPHEPRAWAYLAVLAHLRGEFEIERLMRAAALSPWDDNPEVDHLIGRKLSDKYRFAEGAEYQQRALGSDPGHVPSSFQLAQDMLRLGHDGPGWEMAERVSDRDPYNVVAHNLVMLRDRIRDYRILESDDLRVRMEGREAEIYGEAVLELLGEARDVLFEKYRVEPDGPIVVEIFPQQQDFAIRTFGLPGGAGFLGVCFGRVITANSPASQGERPSNWKSVLWHEMCHVVTLGKTNNRMPRWLSEGISVYEERQRDPGWGEQMTPRYRQMLLEDLTPVSRLSGAFLTPPSPLHLQFAYYQSSLVVEFLVERHGFDALLGILDDLGDGLAINDALVRHVGPLERLDVEFADDARGRAEAFGSGLDWSREGIPGEASSPAMRAWREAHPDNVWAMSDQARVHALAGRWQPAIDLLERLREGGVTGGERGGVLERLAIAYGELGDRQLERRALDEWIEASGDALPGLLRRSQMAADESDWETVLADAERILAIQPLLPAGHLAKADAAERLGRPAATLAAMRSLAAIDPIDRPAMRYRAASALAALGRTGEARREVLMALEEAPRYREALGLLASLHESSSPESSAAADSTAGEPDGDQPDGDQPDGEAGGADGGNAEVAEADGEDSPGGSR